MVSNVHRYSPVRTAISLGCGCNLASVAWDRAYHSQDSSFQRFTSTKRLAAAWNKDYLRRLIGLKPKPV